MTRIGMYKSPAFKVNRIVYSFTFHETWTIELVTGGNADSALCVEEPIDKLLSDYGPYVFL